jgi:Na+/H+ antiporter NhaC
MIDLMGANLYVTVGAILSGGIFGDHCSPISDTTIISSMASASDHIDHVRTQLPYALIAAGGALIIYLIIGLF